MASTSAVRLVRVCKTAGRPLPRFSDDDVIDYMVAEAIVMREWESVKAEQKKRERDDWKKRGMGNG